jgi:hypothetical protein
MLKSWIEQFKIEPEHYGCKLWKYHVSNNMLELFVKKEFIHKEEEYRKAVISIGKILQALRHKLQNAGYQHHIQSFPNIDDPALIAAVRFFNPPETRVKKSQKTQPDTRLIVEALQNFASANQLSLKQLKQSQLSRFVLPDSNSDFNWFALCADHDNPFIWLRVGYWAEFLYSTQLSGEYNISPDPAVTSNLNIANKRLMLNGSVGNKFVQLLIGLPKETAH